MSIEGDPIDVTSPRLLVFSMLFPHPGQPVAGLFIRERMFRVGRHVPLIIVSPQPWFPFQRLVRHWRPHFRPPAPRLEKQQGITVYRPRFLSVPGVLKSLDGLFMALGSLFTLRRLQREFGFNLIDAHFAYPDGYAATLLGRWLNTPVTVTLRGNEFSHAGDSRRRQLVAGLRRATQIFAVANALKVFAEKLGIPGSKIRVISNGIDVAKFYPVPKESARCELGLPVAAPVLISVGGLVEGKGFHRIIACLPALRQRFPDLHYLIVGGPTAAGDIGPRLKQQVTDLGLKEWVHFLGPLPPERLRVPLSAANVFVLATRREGWANVFLEAMACGLPVVTTQVGGNAEVVCRPELGTLVPFGDDRALTDAITEALDRKWDQEAIIAYAKSNTWDERVIVLLGEFARIIAEHGQSDGV